MCQAILEGLRNYLDKKGRHTSGVKATVPLAALAEEDSQMLLRLSSDAAGHQSQANEKDIVDATTGQVLRRELVTAAKRVEMEYFQSKRVYDKVPRSEAFEKMGKAPITVKWVDVNKGDDAEPNYRSRLVAREIRKKWEDSISKSAARRAATVPSLGVGPVQSEPGAVASAPRT